MSRRPTLRSCVTTVAAAAVLVGGADLASYAATGHPLILGHANSAVGTTSLKNLGRGPALSLNSARSAPPLVVNSKKLVKHLNADRLEGMTPGKINPNVLRWHLGVSGDTATNGSQHLFTATVPKGTYEVTWNAFMTKGTGVLTTDSYQCLAGDLSKLTQSVVDPSGFWALDGNDWSQFDSGLIHDTNPALKLSHATKMVFGCFFSGSTGTITYFTPPVLTFHKVTVTEESGQPFVLGPKNGGARILPFGR